MSRIGEIGKKVERGVIKTAERIEKTVQNRVAETHAAYADAVEFTARKHPSFNKVAPEMKISPQGLDLSQGVVRYKPTDTQTQMHPITALVPSKTFKTWLFTHELEHSVQFKDIARAFAGDSVQAGKTAEEGLAFYRQWLGNPKNFNSDYLKKVIQEEGVLSPGSFGYDQVIENIKGFQQYTFASGVSDIAGAVRQIHANTDGFKNITAVPGEVVSAGKRLVQQTKDHLAIKPESEARKASYEYLDKEVYPKMLKDPRFIKLRAGVQKVKKILGLKKADTPRGANNFA